MATHSSVLTWRIRGTGEPGVLLSVGSHRVGHDWSDLAAAVAADGIDSTHVWGTKIQNALLCFKKKKKKENLKGKKSYHLHHFYTQTINVLQKNWCVWIVVLGRTLGSPLDCKDIQPVHSEGDRPWDFFGRNDAKAETPVLWPPYVKSWLIGKDSDAVRVWGQEEKGTIEDEMAGWHPWLYGRESEWTPGVGDGQGGLACCDSWGRNVSDLTEPLNWTELNWFT